MKYKIIIGLLFTLNYNMIYSKELKVLTLNVKDDRSSLPLIAMKKELQQKKIQPDFILLQEMHIESNSHSTIKNYASNLNYTNLSQVKRKEDTESLGILSSYNIMKNPLTGKLSIWSLHLKAKSKYKRVALMTDFLVPLVGRTRVINTHLAHKKDLDTRSVRKNQVEEIINWIKNQQKDLPAQAIIFGGDFNSNKKESIYSGELDTITTTPLSKNLYFQDQNGSTHTSHDNRRIDNIYYASLNSSLSFKSEEILFEEKVKLKKNQFIAISDHKGVLHTYKAKTTQ